MKIVVNTRLLLKDKLEGIGRFSYETLKRLVELRPNDQFVFLFDRPFNDEFIFGDNVVPIVSGPKARHPWIFKYWYNVVVSRVLKREKADLFISMDGMLSLKTNIKQIAVIHDLNFEHFPQYLPKIAANYYIKYFPLFAKLADRIITVSEFSKNDISKKYRIEKTKIDVSCNAASEVFKPNPAKTITKNKYSIGNDYFVYVGSINPRKNLKGVISAFIELKKLEKSAVKLLVVGEVMWRNKDLQSSIKKSDYSEDIIFVGRLNDNELADIIGAAIGLCYVSFFEGFGIPILEAMKCGTPVITSNSSSMPEVAGSATLLVNPNDIDDIKKAMIALCFDNELRNSLIEKGFDQEKKYTWEKAANAINQSIESVL